MKIIFSRKGFDSSAGKTPSPIFPDGGMVSLPIPDRHSPIQYQDIRYREYDLGSLVSALTGGRIPRTYSAHLDPDLNRESLVRQPGWQPIFGQIGISQRHLEKCGVTEGDLFLFFGLFRRVLQSSAGWVWDVSRPRHTLWGWMQIEKIETVDTLSPTQYEWARYHPHFHRPHDRSNTVYLGRKNLTLPEIGTGGLAGSGTFSYFSSQLQLTAPEAASVSLWELPRWCYPRKGMWPLTYHKTMERWRLMPRSTLLQTVGRGQEFVLDTDEYPDALGWVRSLLVSQARVPNNQISERYSQKVQIDY